MQEKRMIEEEETCPPSWCPLEINPGCCHGCRFSKYIPEDHIYCTFRVGIDDPKEDMWESIFSSEEPG
jgi:hypothetical protein